MYGSMLQRLENHYAEKKKDVRNAFGFFAGAAGLFSNILLFVAKLLIGIFSGSVSIIADAVNNLSDTASSALTLAGFHFSGKPADRNHPYGHERFEYISGMIVSLLIVFVGAQFLMTSFDRISNPESIRVSPVILLVLFLSIGIKILQSRLYREVGDKIDSGTLRATAKDSMNDVFTTVAVLLASAVEGFTGWRIDGYVGLLLALYIIVSGIRFITEFIHELLGSRPNQEEIDTMEKLLSNFADIAGYHDLLIHNYGKNKAFASVHIEIDDSWTALRAHEVIDEIEKTFRREMDIELVCHLDPIRLRDMDFQNLQSSLDAVLASFFIDFKMHDLHITREKGARILHFDLVVPQDFNLSEEELISRLQGLVQEKIGRYRLNVTIDRTYLL